MNFFTLDIAKWGWEIHAKTRQPGKRDGLVSICFIAIGLYLLTAVTYNSTYEKEKFLVYTTDCLKIDFTLVRILFD